MEGAAREAAGGDGRGDGLSLKNCKKTCFFVLTGSESILIVSVGDGGAIERAQC